MMMKKAKIKIIVLKKKERFKVMKKNKIIAASAVLLCASTLAACGENQGSSINKEPTNNKVSVSVHYINSGYHFSPSYRGNSQVEGVGGEVLTTGTLLPTWQEFEKNLGIDIDDNTRVQDSEVKKEWEYYLQKGFDGLDIAMTDGQYSINAANTGKLFSIDTLLDEGMLPNFAKWLDKEGGGRNGDLWKSMKSADGQVYYLPFFDGINNLEKMWLMNESYIQKLLDDELPSNLDTKAAKESNFEAQVPTFNQDVEISVNGKASKVHVQYDKSIVTIQNELQTKNGQTYVQALRDYIDKIYKPGENNEVYKKRSEIFTSEAACYNADELVALMRCMINNPHFLNGTDKLYAFAPRSGQGSRLKQMMEFTNIWGQRGVSAEHGRLYFGADQQLHDARTDESTYENLDKLHELYKEGFFPDNFYKGYGGTNPQTEWRSNLMKSGQVFSLYDYNATSTAYNGDSLEGSKSILKPMLPPVAKWEDADTNTPEYFHFSEDNRALKSGGWAIMADTDALYETCKLADYMWCDEGADIINFGPNNESYRKAVTTYDPTTGERQSGAGTIDLGGNTVVAWGDKVFATKYENGDSFASNWSNFLQKYIGSGFGIGHMVSSGCDYQATTSKAAQEGLSKVTSAITSGVFRVCTSATVTDKFLSSVPSSFALSSANQTAIQNSKDCTTMAKFWDNSSKEANGNVIYCYWICNGKTDTNVTGVITSFETFKTTFKTVDSIYLQAYKLAYISMMQ